MMETKIFYGNAIRHCPQCPLNVWTWTEVESANYICCAKLSSVLMTSHVTPQITNYPCVYQTPFCKHFKLNTSFLLTPIEPKSDRREERIRTPLLPADWTTDERAGCPMGDQQQAATGAGQTEKGMCWSPQRTYTEAGSHRGVEEGDAEEDWWALHKDSLKARFGQKYIICSYFNCIHQKQLFGKDWIRKNSISYSHTTITTSSLVLKLPLFPGIFLTLYKKILRNLLFLILNNKLAPNRTTGPPKVNTTIHYHNI